VIVGDIEVAQAAEGRRTALWVQVERGSQNQRKACPVEAHTLVSLQPAAFKKGVKVTLTGILLRAFFPVDIIDARSLGSVSVAGAVAQWSKAYGRPTDDTEVWVISFVLGDRTAFYRKHAERYLKAKMGGGRTITTDPLLAARDEQAVPREDEMRYAAQAATERVTAAQDALWDTLAVLEREIKKLAPHRDGLDKAALQDLEYMERRAASMRRELRGRAA